MKKDQRIEIILQENAELREKNKKLKADLDKFSEAYKKYRDYEKEELAESCYDLARENEKLKEMYNVYVTGTLKLKEENKKLENKIKNLKFVRRTIENCVVLAFLCLICSGVVCMFIETMIDVIMGFQFVRWM